MESGAERKARGCWIKTGHPRMRTPGRFGASCEGNSVLASGLRRDFLVLARRHGNDGVFALLAVAFQNAKQELVLAYAVFGDFADRQKRRMLFVRRTNAVNDVVRLEHIFLAEQLFGFAALRIGAEEFAGNALAAFFLRTARAGVHAEQSALLIVMLLCRGNAGEEQTNYS